MRQSVLVHAAAAAKLLQSCPTLCDSIDGSPPGPPVPGILHALNNQVQYLAVHSEVRQAPVSTPIKPPLARCEEEVKRCKGCAGHRVWTQ